MPTVKVFRTDDQVRIEIREFDEETVRHDQPTWEWTTHDEPLRRENVVTLRLPASEADILFNGLAEAGVGGKRKGGDE